MLKNSFVLILFVWLVIFLVALGCVRVKTDDVDVSVDPGGITVNDDGDEIKIDDKGAVVNEEEGNLVEVRDNVVHISGDELTDYPEGWPEDVKVHEAFTMTDLYVRGGTADVEAHREIVSRTELDIDMSDVMDFYTLMDGWRPDMMSQPNNELPDGASWIKLLKDNNELEITIIPETENVYILILRVYGEKM